MTLRGTVALLLLALPLAACGGTSDVTSLDPVAQAADRTTSVAGAHFQMSGRIGDKGETIAFSGPGTLAATGTITANIGTTFSGVLSGGNLVMAGTNTVVSVACRTSSGAPDPGRT